MSQPNEKPCIQKRIKLWLAKILFNPLYLSIFCFVLFSLSVPLYTEYLEALDYNRAKDLVESIVKTDGFIIAFTGVIATLIVKHILEKEKEEKASGYAVIAGENRAESEFNCYKKKRRDIINFIAFILLILTFSIILSLSVIITQRFFFVIWSMLLLFIGIIELITMIYYSLK